MYFKIFNMFEKLGLTESLELVAYATTLLIILGSCIVIHLIVKLIIIKVAIKVSKHTKLVWDDILFSNKVFHRLANLSIPTVLGLFQLSLPNDILIEKIVNISAVLVIMLILDPLINAVDEIYRLYEISKTRPIRSVLQVLKAVNYILSGLLCIAALAGQSPFVLLGGVGAMTAVTTLIFKDGILGFVAGIQLTANDMIRIGDWIEAPQCLANGDVIDLSMTTVKVQNFDKTITTIPAYTLLSDAFINWRGMQDIGGRRIKRALYIDAAGVKFCDDEMIERFRGIGYLTEYINTRLSEIGTYNTECKIDMSNKVNGRRITNVGTLRAYITEYLKQHPGIHPDMTIMVRQLQPEERGLPLEIYAFASTTDWIDYEGIQADIFDHLYAVVPEFGLEVYQAPSSTDVRKLKVI